MKVVLLSITIPAKVQENNVDVQNAPSKGPIDPTELEAFIDALLKKEMDKNYIVGTGGPR